MGLACPGMASSHSRAFAVRGHHRARATFGFSTSSRCCQRRYKTASLKALANSERASNSGRTWALDFMRDFIILSFLLLLLVSLLKNFGFIIFFFFFRLILELCSFGRRFLFRRMILWLIRMIVGSLLIFECKDIGDTFLFIIIARESKVIDFTIPEDYCSNSFLFQFCYF